MVLPSLTSQSHTTRALDGSDKPRFRIMFSIICYTINTDVCYIMMGHSVIAPVVYNICVPVFNVSLTVAVTV